VIVELGRIYAQGIDVTQRKIIDLFTTGGSIPWSPEDLRGFKAIAATTATQILPLARRLVDYTHIRTIQRLTLGAIESGATVLPDDTDPGSIPVVDAG